MSVDYKNSVLSWIRQKHLYYNDTSLSIELNEKGVIELQDFKNLTSLSCDFKEIKNFHHITELKWLGISSYKDGYDLIENNTRIVDIILTRCSISNLSELNNLNQLKNVDLYSCSKLVDISGLRNKSNIKKLEIESCKNIPISHLIEVISTLKHLEVLKLHKFEFPDLNWVSSLPNLVDFVITDCNVIDGDISPAAHLEYVAIDNRKHYNYRFDSETRTIQPVIPKSTYVAKTEIKVIKSLFSLPHFGDIDLKNPNQDYETDMEWGERRVNLGLYFNEVTTSKAKLNKAKTLLNQLEKDIPIILNLFKKNHTEGGIVSEYFDHFQEETGKPYSEDLWHELFLNRLAFYPDIGEDYAVYDFGFDEISPNVLSLKVDQKGNITGCEMES